MAPSIQHLLGLLSSVDILEAEQLLSQLQLKKDSPQGVKDDFLDTLHRIPRKELAQADCAICTESFLDDPYPLVVQLRCGHKFDLSCIGPWLKMRTTCPLCRASVYRDTSGNNEQKKDDDEFDALMYG
ncbi:hypothetical protein DAMA08_052700 [Martiniozyma asiatica (nom. inval.)]|nr:hypothetical protein DAMA08_052700 [Martiniozyma asiatica]